MARVSAHQKTMFDSGTKRETLEMFAPFSNVKGLRDFSTTYHFGAVKSGVMIIIIHNVVHMLGILLH